MPGLPYSLSYCLSLEADIPHFLLHFSILLLYFQYLMLIFPKQLPLLFIYIPSSKFLIALTLSMADNSNTQHHSADFHCPTTNVHELCFKLP